VEEAEGVEALRVELTVEGVEDVEARGLMTVEGVEALGSGLL
jgi:hypothetical protein